MYEKHIMVITSKPFTYCCWDNITAKLFLIINIHLQFVDIIEHLDNYRDTAKNYKCIFYLNLLSVSMSTTDRFELKPWWYWMYPVCRYCCVTLKNKPKQKQMVFTPCWIIIKVILGGRQRSHKMTHYKVCKIWISW